MDVKAGYKQTDFGVIPEDWTVAELRHVCNEPITYGIVQCGPHVDNGVPYIRVSDMDARELDVTRMLRTSTTIAARFGRSTVREADIVYALRGTLGEVRQVGESVAGANLTQGTARLSPKAAVNSAYLLWAMRSQRLLRQAELEAKGTTFREITLADLRRIKVPLPPAREQEAIAEALSDADALIESVEQLLAKKRQIKQGAMQELLTGTKRLPGFETKSDHRQTEAGVLAGDWCAGDIGHAVERLEAGASVNSEKDETAEYDSYPCVLKTGAASAGSFVPRESKRVARCDLWRLRVSVRKNTILVSRMNIVDLVGESGYVTFDFPNLFVPDRMWMATIRSTVSPRWFSYVLSWAPVKSQISASATGTSGSMKNISKPSFRAVKVRYPPLNEQRAIANVLSEMDAEIVALEAKLAKARQIKQGMMQELLTGRIRLV